MQIRSSQQFTDSPSIDPTIAITDLCFSYPDNPDVLRHITLNICQGDRVGLIGYNGCGKTTLFLLICGVLTPSSGEIRLLNQRVRPGTFYPEIGLVFQNPDDQLFSASVWDDVAFAPQNMGLLDDEVHQRVTEALAITGVQELATRPPHHLSGGQKRMVAIAGILAMRPQIIIYDEPTANLDLRARRRLIQFLQQSQETLLIASHDLEFVLEVCDRVVLMDEGQIVADGNPRQLMSDIELMEKHGLERPYSLRP
ncbi:energy-coupling factor ABC transporter ATP-binding protein [Thermocoleostomius sinensis]|uniref:Energy-coupling factor ABC transporter ATP-binding protein n=1 Tax=Thermocoleostomius sinensis A174 TaxID=2016057 RepID=A0A9E8Z8B4_9CYAN|nr:energy-coupling factor ABC transporter ATP-binding protein [Thermocoleostomius sinensis]WAL58345.1 energy-coupling factor ABC transporter ATP-binding protein [Thermocoleostomius sinensis A174]